MPTSETFNSVPMMGNVVQVPVVDDKAFAAFQIQRNTATDAEWDDMLQSLVDLLQGWHYRRQGSNVTGQKYVTGYYETTPTNPDVDDTAPPEDPPPVQPGEGDPGNAA